MNACPPSLSVLLRAWVVMVAVVAVCGWSFGAVGANFLMGPAALVILLILAVRWRGALLGALRTEGRALVGFWPVAVLFGLMLTLAVAYEVSVHDTLTYRLPRIRLWLQDGGLEWYNGADVRINGLGRNWEWLGMAILQVTRSERLLVLPSLISWVLLCRIFFWWGDKFVGGGGITARTASLVLASSPLFVVQGFTTMNDLMGGALVATSVAFLLSAWEADGERSGGMDLVFSGLALAVATGVKPNLGILAVLWCLGALLWWRGRRGTIPWGLLAIAAPVGVIASGLPTLMMNYAHTGSPMANMDEGDLGVAPTSLLGGVVVGHLMFWWQSAQPVFNPLAGILNSATAGIDARLSQVASRFQLETESFRFGESATIGVFSTILIVIGVFLAMRKCSSESRRRGLVVWLALGALVGMSLNFGFAIPFELGRSSATFLLPLVPLALVGIGTLKGAWRKIVPVLAVLSFASCILHLSLEPNRSLLPANVKASLVEAAGGSKGVAYAEAFRTYRTRRFSGKELFELVPEDAGAVAICLDRNAPTAAAWKYLPRGTRVAYYRSASLETLAAAPENYIILAGSAAMAEPALSRSDLYQLVAQRIYLIRLKEGEKPWYLFKRIKPAPGAEQ